MCGRKDWLGSALNHRHAIQEFDDGAVLIDLDTGESLQLNLTAAFTYRHMVRGAPVDEIATLFAAQFGLAKDQALADVSHFMASPFLPRVNEPEQRTSPFRYIASDGVLAVVQDDTPLLYVDPSGRSLSLATAVTQTVRAAVAWAVPKLLILQGHPVLHASAVSINGRAIAFSGPSGAGKTTMARAFATAGAALLAEDFFVVRLDGAHRAIGITALEKGSNAWIDRALSGLGKGGRIVSDAIFTPEEGAVVPLTQLNFLDARRRTGKTLHRARIGPTAAAGGILRNLFWASVDEVGYRRGLNWATEISNSVECYKVTSPADVTGVLSAAKSYVENTAS